MRSKKYHAIKSDNIVLTCDTIENPSVFYVKNNLY